MDTWNKTTQKSSAIYKRSNGKALNVLQSAAKERCYQILLHNIVQQSTTPLSVPLGLVHNWNIFFDCLHRIVKLFTILCLPNTSCWNRVSSKQLWSLAENHFCKRHWKLFRYCPMSAPWWVKLGQLGDIYFISTIKSVTVTRAVQGSNQIREKDGKPGGPYSHELPIWTAQWPRWQHEKYPHNKTLFSFHFLGGYSKLLTRSQPRQKNCQQHSAER